MNQQHKCMHWEISLKPPFTATDHITHHITLPVFPMIGENLLKFPFPTPDQVPQRHRNVNASSVWGQPFKFRNGRHWLSTTNVSPCQSMHRPLFQSVTGDQTPFRVYPCSSHLGSVVWILGLHFCKKSILQDVLRETVVVRTLISANKKK